ncbi:hypothetical protein H7F51_10270 [Novosphingobium flavum]|uniref:GDT1 family protein n=1 Tax=Novosphingobium flavum TaxID=1778672 RepID=A0A7X1KM45_9SPHN|nr:hypothetical protein [Novosphingobium flavum]MBC2665910.1 hypothetical protein [Novosphingobium flavum]
MSAFLFAFLAVLVCGIGARDQSLVAGVTRVQGQRPLLLLTALAAAAATTAFAGWAATRLVADMVPAARILFAAMALVLAGLEILVLRAPRQPEEPTGSLFAAFVVLAAQQITDGARFLILAIAVATAMPLTAALGGGMASMAMVSAGWLRPDLVAARPVRLVRRLAGTVLVLIGLWLGLAQLIG